MKLSQDQIRLLIMHEYRSGRSVAEAARLINKAWGNGTVEESTVQRWFSTFKEASSAGQSTVLSSN